jgi:oligopeptidase B
MSGSGSVIACVCVYVCEILNTVVDLVQAAVAGVPFVDIMVTMCDPSIPLTITEWEEWGNPNEKLYHDYMKSYRCVSVCPVSVCPSMCVSVCVCL